MIGAYTEKEYKKLVKKIQKALAEKYGEDKLPEFDVEAYIDSSITEEENLNEAEQRWELALTKHTKKELIEIEREYNEKSQQAYLEELQKLQQKALEKIKELGTTPTLDDYYAPIEQYVQAAANKHIHGLVLLGGSGQGKSFVVIKTLTRMGKVMGDDYAIINCHSSPLDFYNKIFEYKDKIIVLDDIGDSFLKKSEVKAMLKSALWGNDGLRTISWYSTSEKRKAPETFDFSGSLIICANEIPNDEDTKAIFSRSIVQEINIPYFEKLKMMYELANNIDYGISKEEAIKVMDTIKEHSDETVNQFDFRTLLKGIALYKQNKENYPALIRQMLSKDPIAVAIKEAIAKSPIVKEQAKLFTELTGKSRATFFRFKNKYKMEG
jgi:hypothetical protein